MRPPIRTQSLSVSPAANACRVGRLLPVSTCLSSSPKGRVSSPSVTGDVAGVWLSAQAAGAVTASQASAPAASARPVEFCMFSPTFWCELDARLAGSCLELPSPAGLRVARRTRLSPQEGDYLAIGAILPGSCDAGTGPARRFCSGIGFSGIASRYPDLEPAPRPARLQQSMRWDAMPFVRRPGVENATTAPASDPDREAKDHAGFGSRLVERQGRGHRPLDPAHAGGDADLHHLLHGPHQHRLRLQGFAGIFTSTRPSRGSPAASSSSATCSCRSPAGSSPSGGAPRSSSAS